MRESTPTRAAGRLAILAAFTLGACASKQPEPVVLPPLVLGGYQADAPRNQACDSLIGQAVERDAKGGFRLVGMLNTNTYPKPGQSQVRASPDKPLVPYGSHMAVPRSPQLDGTFRSLFVNCETRQAYVAKRGGVIDITYWYGPFGL